MNILPTQQMTYHGADPLPTLVSKDLKAPFLPLWTFLLLLKSTMWSAFLCKMVWMLKVTTFPTSPTNIRRWTKLMTGPPSLKATYPSIKTRQTHPTL